MPIGTPALKCGSAALGAAFLLSAGGMLGCTGSTCKNAVIQGLPSPDAAAIAFVYHRSCGAPATVSTHVSIIAFKNSLHNDAGNVLVVGNEQPVKISWQSPKRLVVTGFHDATYQRTEPMDSITVQFQ
jgi:hypothetical protein